MLRRFVLAALTIPDWLYGRRAAGLDLGPGALAAGWATLMICRPEMFDRGSFVGMGWVPDPIWIFLMVVMTILHLAGLVRPNWRPLRTSAALLSAWAWIFVAVSFARVEIGTGVIAYGIFGIGALGASFYLAGQPRERR